jgi:hypothetical protein
MKKLVVVGIAAALLVAAPAFGASWHVVKSKSISGQFGVTAFNATVRHPLAMRLRLSGANSSGDAVVACSRGFSISSYSRTYSHAGTYNLPIRPRRAGSCQVTVSIAVSGGSARATLYVYR